MKSHDDEHYEAQRRAVLADNPFAAELQAELAETKKRLTVELAEHAKTLADFAASRASEKDLGERVTKLEDILLDISLAHPEDLKTLDCVRLLARIVSNARTAISLPAAKVVRAAQDAAIRALTPATNEEQK